MRFALWMLIALVVLPGCSGKPALVEGNVKVTSTADLGKAVGTGR